MANQTQLLVILAAAALAIWGVSQLLADDKKPPPDGGEIPGGEPDFPQIDDFPIYLDYVRAYYSWDLAVRGCNTPVTGSTTDEIYANYLVLLDLCGT